tara:strand:- start:61 stop:609 length:549 start_codon:yes stop_codon:yes gene_type:complete
MAFSKIIAESMDLTDTYAFTGTVTGAGGIVEADQWRINNNISLSASTNTLISSYWERNDSSFNKIGTGLTESSGTFSFPSTGIYLIHATLNLYRAGDSRFFQLKPHATTDDSNYTEVANSSMHIKQTGSNTFGGCNASFIFDVTNVSTHKFRIYVEGGETATLDASTTSQKTGFYCIKLGDT